MKKILIALTLVSLLTCPVLGKVHHRLWLSQSKSQVRRNKSARRETIRTESRGKLTRRNSVAATTQICQTKPRLSGTVIQPELVTTWTVDQWKQEFKNMKDACITKIILQYTTKIGGQNIAFYPTKIPNYIQAAGSSEMIDRMFAAADAVESEVEVYLGLQYRKSPSGNPLPNNWDNDEARLNKMIADDLWEKYSQQVSFKKHFKGWYLPLEVENLSFQGEEQQKELINFYQQVVEHLHKKHTGIPFFPVITAPFFNTSVGQKSKDWGSMWARILTHTNLDIVALQDSIGPLTDDSGHQTYHASVQELPEWFGATRAAVNEAKRLTGRDIQLWADTEIYFEDYHTHRDFGDFDCPAVKSALQEIMYPLPGKRLVEDMRAVNEYVDDFISFSFNHYMSPQQLWGNYYKTYVQYLTSGVFDQTSPTAPNQLVAIPESSDSVRLSWAPSIDNVGVAGYIIYRDNEILRTLYLHDNENSCVGFHDKSSLEKPLMKATKYEYRVVAFDAAGNKSVDRNIAQVTTSAYDIEQMVSLGKSYSTSIPAVAPYKDVTGKALTDSFIGDESSYECWQGRQTDQPYSFTVDLGDEHNIGAMNSDWLQKKKDSVYLPKKVRYQISTDGNNFRDIGEVTRPVDSDCLQAVKYSLINLNVTARYVRMIVEPDHGWTMTSEFQIFKTVEN